MEEHKFSIGNYVWAKKKGFAPWPAEIVEPNEEAKPINEKRPKQCVRFFGIENYAWIVEDQIWDYLESRGEFVKPSPKVLPSFRNAIEEIEDAVKSRPGFTPIDPSLLIGTSERGLIIKEASDTGERSRMRKRSLELKAKQEQQQNGSNDSPTTAPKPRKIARQSLPSKTEKKQNSTTKQPKETAYSHVDSSWGLPDILSSPSSTLLPGVTSPTDLDTGEELGERKLNVKIGFLGLGKLGSLVVRCLLEAGHDVTVWNRTPSKCREFVSWGARKGMSPGDVVQSCDITFSCLSDSHALKDLLSNSEGEGGVLDEICPGKSFVNMSTCDVDTIIEVNKMITSRGGRFLEAPIIGSLHSDMDEGRRLLVVAAGDRDLYTDCFTCFQAIALRTFYVGAAGSAACLKLVTNVLQGTMLAGVAECLALGEKVGLSQQSVLDVLRLLPFHCELYRQKGSAMMNNEFNPPQLSLEHMQRDLKLSISLAESVEQPVHVTTATNELFKRAKTQGYGDHDTAAIYRATE